MTAEGGKETRAEMMLMLSLSFHSSCTFLPPLLYPIYTKPILSSGDFIP